MNVATFLIGSLTDSNDSWLSGFVSPSLTAAAPELATDSTTYRIALEVVVPAAIRDSIVSGCAKIC